MTPDQITTIVTSIFGYGAVAISLERLRREFAQHKREVVSERDKDRSRIKALEDAA